MRKWVALGLIIFNFVCYSQKRNEGIVVVLENLKKQVVCWNNGDINGFMNFYWNNDSLLFISSKGITNGWQKTHDNYIKNYPNKASMGLLKFTIVKTESVSKTCIYVIGKWELEREKTAGGHFTLLWKKLNGKWVIVSDHTS